MPSTLTLRAPEPAAGSSRSSSIVVAIILAAQATAAIDTSIIGKVLATVRDRANAELTRSGWGLVCR
jgi:hypothetical protein